MQFFVYFGGGVQVIAHGKRESKQQRLGSLAVALSVESEELFSKPEPEDHAPAPLPRGRKKQKPS
jgi:hypothetical protein